MESSRIRNSKRNIISGVVRQLLNIVLAFVSRTAVLYLMGAQYLGLGSLFTSILTVLNLADLGFTVAVIYILYKPIAENNKEEICAILAYLRKVYWLIGAVILVLGMAIIPFLKHLISSSYPQEINIYILYFLFLMNTVFSFWFFAYKGALLTATQRNDIVNNAYAFSSIGAKCIQIVMLMLFRNYYIFTAVLLAGTLVNNLLLQYFSRKLYPDIFPKGVIRPALKQEMNRQVQSIFICRVGDVTRNSCDSIFISIFLGLTAIAIYDNYYYIFNAVFGVIWLVSEALQASVGNSIALESVDKNRKDLYLFDFIFTWFIGWCMICLFCLYQPFMRIWMNGNVQMMLSNRNVLLLCLYFYVLALNNIRNLYINGAGLFVKLKWWYILESVANIVLNTVLGYFLGITGIILATLISVFICNFVARTNVLFREYFKTGLFEFYRNHAAYFFATVLACGLSCFMCRAIPLDGIYELLKDIVICIFVPNLVYLLLYCKTDMFRRFVKFVGRILGKDEDSAASGETSREHTPAHTGDEQTVHPASGKTTESGVHKKTRVIEFIQTMGDGGAETLVKDYALLMDKEKFEIIVVVLHALDDSANLQRLRENGIEVLALSSQDDVLKKMWRKMVKPSAVDPTLQHAKEQKTSETQKSMTRQVLHFLRNHFFGRKLMRIIRNTGATVIHAHLEVLEILQAVSGSLHGIRLLHTCHNVPSIIYVDGERPAAKDLIQKNGLQLVALHSEMAEELKQMFRIDDVVTIRNGIDMPRFTDPGIDRVSKRRKTGIPEDAFVLGHVGRFSEQKNHMFLVEIFREVAKQCENSFLLMIGAGDCVKVEAKLREYGLQDRYMILRHRKDINELLKAMDVFVFPSLFEGLSVSLVEAQAAGLRCIVSDQCSEEGFCTETCIPMPLIDPKKWADAVLDSGLRRETSRNLLDYDMNQEIRRLEKLYLGYTDC